MQANQELERLANECEEGKTLSVRYIASHAMRQRDQRGRGRRLRCRESVSVVQQERRIHHARLPHHRQVQGPRRDVLHASEDVRDLGYGFERRRVSPNRKVRPVRYEVCALETLSARFVEEDALQHMPVLGLP